MGDGAGRFGAGQSDNPRNDSRSDGRRAGLAGLVAKQAIDAFFGKTSLPAPNRGAADAGAARHFQHRQSLAGKKNDFGALHMFEGTVAITDNLLQAFGVGGVQKDADCLGHGRRLARFRDFVNPMTASMHWAAIVSIARRSKSHMSARRGPCAIRLIASAISPPCPEVKELPSDIRAAMNGITESDQALATSPLASMAVRQNSLICCIICNRSGDSFVLALMLDSDLGGINHFLARGQRPANASP
jgi:hypothetical protein